MPASIHLKSDRCCSTPPAEDPTHLSASSRRHVLAAQDKRDPRTDPSFGVGHSDRLQEAALAARTLSDGAFDPAVEPFPATDR
jgi:hypothetical protein